MIGFIFGYMLGSLEEKPCGGGYLSTYEMTEVLDQLREEIDKLYEEQEKN